MPWKMLKLWEHHLGRHAHQLRRPKPRLRPQAAEPVPDRGELFLPELPDHAHLLPLPKQSEEQKEADTLVEKAEDERLLEQVSIIHDSRLFIPSWLTFRQCQSRAHHFVQSFNFPPDELVSLSSEHFGGANSFPMCRFISPVSPAPWWPWQGHAALVIPRAFINSDLHCSEF